MKPLLLGVCAVRRDGSDENTDDCDDDDILLLVLVLLLFVFRCITGLGV